jgi:hypothetical protein
VQRNRNASTFVIAVTRLTEPPGDKDNAMDPISSPARRVIATAALAGIAALAAACTSGQSPSPAKTITVSAAPSTGAAAAAATTPASNLAPSSSPAAPAGPGPCPTRSLQVKLGVSQGTAGSVYTAIDFTNIGNVTCTLYGYPGVSLAGGKPVKQIGKAAVENPATPRALVTLQPNTTGNALLQIVDAGNYPPNRCDPMTAHYLQIYPPNQTTPVFLRYKIQACAKPVRLLTVDVVKPGSGSS